MKGGPDLGPGLGGGFPAPRRVVTRQADEMEANYTGVSNSDMLRRDPLQGLPHNKETVMQINKAVDRRMTTKTLKTNAKLGYLSKAEEKKIIRNVQLYFSLSEDRLFVAKIYLDNWRSSLK